MRHDAYMDTDYVPDAYTFIWTQTVRHDAYIWTQTVRHDAYIWTQTMRHGVYIYGHRM